jgi:hypothetical protein
MRSFCSEASRKTVRVGSGGMDGSRRPCHADGTLSGLRKAVLHDARRRCTRTAHRDTGGGWLPALRGPSRSQRDGFRGAAVCLPVGSPTRAASPSAATGFRAECRRCSAQRTGRSAALRNRVARPQPGIWGHLSRHTDPPGADSLRCLAELNRPPSVYPRSCVVAWCDRFSFLIQRGSSHERFLSLGHVGPHALGGLA